ncbi:MAG: type II secretion system protein, partial [Prosthecobacter sp.]|nr:type II secretion system protein [Prosthecobacter sp.]
MKLCPQLNPPSAHRQPGGFTIIELVVLIALMGVLITVIVVSVGSQPATIRNIKLGADVATLNQLVSAYVADGGNLAGLTSPQTVLDRLKKGRPQTEWQRHTGATSGKLADVRLRARTTTTPSTEGLERAKWNTRTMHFEMTTGTGTAVSEFYLDDTLSTTDFGTDTRAAPNVKFNTSSRGWVWASASSPAFTYATPGASTGPGVNHPFDPTETVPVPPTPPDSGGGSGGGGGGGGGSGGGGSTTPAPTKLPTPLISPSGGTFAYAAFPSLITVSGNGAPSGSSSVLQYRINGGAWISYSGPVTIASSNLLQARNATLDVTVYYNSNTASATYYRLTEGFTG